MGDFQRMVEGKRHQYLDPLYVSILEACRGGETLEELIQVYDDHSRRRYISWRFHSVIADCMTSGFLERVWGKAGELDSIHTLTKLGEETLERAKW